MSDTPVGYRLRRFDELLTGLERLAGGELSGALPISGAEDHLDAIAYGINVLVGELKWAHAMAKEAEAERMAVLSAAKDQAEQASREKTEFLRSLSHELRTPLTTILMTIQLLQDADLSPQRGRDLLDAVHRNGRVLLELIEGVLDLSSIEAGKLSIEAKPIVPEEVIADVIRDLEPQAMVKGVNLTFSAAPPPRRLTTDPRRFRQILANMIANGIKFTERGDVRVTLERPTPHETVVLVADTGIGMDAEQQARIFQAFSQVHSSSSRLGGTGLGLVLSRRLAQALGGDLALVTSQIDRGSTFRLTMVDGPAPATAKAAGARRTSADITGSQILVAEDDEDLRRALCDLLERHGAVVALATDGQDAVRQALARPFDVVLMDIRMPRMDGIKATRALRASGYEGAIIALTAEAFSEDRERCLQAGCNGYVPKPIDVGELLAQIKRPGQ